MGFLKYFEHCGFNHQKIGITHQTTGINVETNPTSIYITILGESSPVAHVADVNLRILKPYFAGHIPITLT
jgi:hypothetical protein